MTMTIDRETEAHYAKVIRHGTALCEKLAALHAEIETAEKTLRPFSLAEAAYFLRVTPSYLKKLHYEGKGPCPTTTGSGRRTYTDAQIQQLRGYLAEIGRRKHYLPGRRENDHLQIISVTNFKGGSAKTTTAAHLAQHLALTGHRTLVIDIDPQASLSALYGIQPEFAQNRSLYDAIRYDSPCPIADVIRPTVFTHLDIVPANLDLQEYEYETARSASARGEGRFFHRRIRQALETVDDRYDVVVIDCPPQLGYLTLTALAASTAMLVTIHPQMLDVMSMGQFMTMLGGVLESLSPYAELKLDWMRYLVTRFEPNDIPQAQMAGFLLSLFPADMLQNKMLKSTTISDAGLTNNTLYEVERTQFTRGAYDRAMESLLAVNEEITGLIHKSWGRVDETDWSE